MNYYLGKQFQEAANAFEKVLSINVSDLTARLFYEKTQNIFRRGHQKAGQVEK